MKRVMAIALAAGLMTVASSPAWGETPDWGSEGEKAPQAPQAAPETFDAAEEASGDPFLSVTMAPLLLLFSSLELMAEARVHEYVGVSVIPTIGRPDGISTYGLGAGVNFYPLRSFRNVFLGAEVQTLLAQAEVDGVSVRGSGIGGSGYAGFKAIASFGLTFMGQLGYSFMDFEATGTAPSGATQTFHADFTGPLLRLNLGWSF